jgi:hypothetical protein
MIGVPATFACNSSACLKGPLKISGTLVRMFARAELRDSSSIERHARTKRHAVELAQRAAIP